MLKLNTGISRKIGQNFGSRGASVNFELEVESALANDPNGLMDRVRRLFQLAREAVDEELRAMPANPDSPSANGQARANNVGNGQQSTRHATQSQMRAIRAICKRQNVDADRFAKERFRVNDLGELTIGEASSLIDELKANGNGSSR